MFFFEKLGKMCSCLFLYLETPATYLSICASVHSVLELPGLRVTARPQVCAGGGRRRSPHIGALLCARAGLSV